MLCLALLFASNVAIASDGDETVANDQQSNWHPLRSRELTAEELRELRSLLQGKSEADVVALLGFPNATSNTASEFRLEYAFGTERICITIRAGQVLSSGVVINAEEQERQTGVRDDDFVGVGP
jgi:hypothetical protein